MPPGNPFVRRDIWSLDPEDPVVIAYGDAVAAMKAKPADDPTSWAYQAAIHGSVAPPLPLFNECRHQSWYFLPWHRMYLYFFERIVRAEVLAAGGPSDWALPFWDYDRVGTNRLPRAFRNPTRADGSPNPLFVSSRNPGINSGAAALPPSTTSAAFALSRPNYTGTTEFGGGIASAGGQFMGRTGRVEATPHNDVHVLIGGLMGNPDTAGQDPIFWLHHANVDRLWWVWDDATHANPTDPNWSQQEFEFFDEDGKQVTMECSQVEDIVNQLDYTYQRRIRFPNLRLPVDLLERFRVRPPGPPWIREVRPVPVPPDDPRRARPDRELVAEIVGASDRAARLVGGAERVKVPVEGRARREALRERAPSQVVLNIENIEAERNPGTVYGVYVNLPDNPTPEDLAAHHAGNVSLFGIERTVQPRGDSHAHGAMQVAMDITDLVTSLAEQGKWSDEELDVTFRPITLEVVEDAAEADAMADEVRRSARHEDTPVDVGRISVHMR